jgi:excisionase family DNA binding protein
MSMSVPIRPLLDVAQTARRLRLSEKQARRLIVKGEIPAYRLGGPGSAIRVSARELDSWLDLQRVSDDGSWQGQLRAGATPAERRAPESSPAVEAQAIAGAQR